MREENGRESVTKEAMGFAHEPIVQKIDSQKSSKGSELSSNIRLFLSSQTVQGEPVGIETIIAPPSSVDGVPSIDK